MRRAEAFEAKRDFRNALDDINRILKSDSTNPTALAYARRLIQTMAMAKSGDDLMETLGRAMDGDSEAALSLAGMASRVEFAKRLVSALPVLVSAISTETLIIEGELEQQKERKKDRLHNLTRVWNLVVCIAKKSQLQPAMDAATISSSATQAFLLPSDHLQLTVDTLTTMVATLESPESCLKIFDVYTTALKAKSCNEQAFVVVLNSLIVHLDKVPSFLSRQLISHDLLTTLLAPSTSTPISADSPETTSRHSVAVLMQRLTNGASETDMDTLKRVTLTEITRLVDSTENAAKLRGLKALENVFSGNQIIGLHVLLSNDLLKDIAESVEFESEIVQRGVLEVLSVACADKACRTMVATLLNSWLKNLSNSSSALDENKNLARLVMTKIRGMEDTLNKDTNNVESFIKLVLSPQIPLDQKTNAVEGLAYLSMDADIKESLTYDNPDFIKYLVVLSKSDNKPLQYGISCIFANLTRYRKKLTDEEDQVRKLKEFAKEIPKSTIHEKDNDEWVEKRGTNLITFGILSGLTALSKVPSGNVREMVSECYLSLACNAKNRGGIVAQSGVKSLLTLTSLSSLATATQGGEAGNNTSNGRILASQALAKIAISSDPNLVFKDRAIELVTPLVGLLKDEHQLRQFEGLMGLTNLASMDDGGAVRSRIVALKGDAEMENLMFSENTLIRRAATEAMCNMVYDPAVFDRYAKSRDSARLRLFVALSDVDDDYETRRAAAGVLAILTNDARICQALSEEKTAFGLLLGMVSDSKVEIRCRGIECVKNICAVSKDLADKILNTCGGWDVVKQAISGDSKKEQEERFVVEAAKETIRSALALGVSRLSPGSQS